MDAIFHHVFIEHLAALHTRADDAVAPPHMREFMEDAVVGVFHLAQVADKAYGLGIRYHAGMEPRPLEVARAFQYAKVGVLIRRKFLGEKLQSAFGRGHHGGDVEWMFGLVIYLQ